MFRGMFIPPFHCHRIFVHLIYLFFRILRKLLLGPSRRICRVIYSCFKEDCWYSFCWNALVEINIHQKSARRTARHPSLSDDPPCPRKNPTELISWQPRRVSTFRTRDTWGTKHSEENESVVFFLSHHEEELQSYHCALRGLRWGQSADGADSDMTRNEVTAESGGWGVWSWWHSV